MPDYASVAEFKNEVQVDSATMDTEIEAILDAAEETINGVCNRPDGFLADATASARYYTGRGLAWMEIDECVAVTAVAVKDSPGDDEADYTAWTVGIVGTTADADVFPARGGPEAPDYNRTPYNLLVIGSNASYDHFTSGQYTTRRGFRPSRTGKRGTPTVQVTARWGYAAAVPDQIKQATIMQAARWYQRLKASMADTTAGPEFGTLMYRKVLDPDIELILKGARLMRPTTGGGP